MREAGVDRGRRMGKYSRLHEDHCSRVPQNVNRCIIIFRYSTLCFRRNCNFPSNIFLFFSRMTLYEKTLVRLQYAKEIKQLSVTILISQKGGNCFEKKTHRWGYRWFLNSSLVLTYNQIHNSNSGVIIPMISQRRYKISDFNETKNFSTESKILSKKSKISLKARINTTSYLF